MTDESPAPADAIVTCPICLRIDDGRCRELCWPELVKRYGELCAQLNAVEDAIDKAELRRWNLHRDGTVIQPAHWQAILKAIK